MALQEVESEWVFLADDDNRFESNLIETVFLQVEQYGVRATSVAYPQNKEAVLSSHVRQAEIFGAGNSFVKNTLLSDISFNAAYEFGYGEDNDFGMQLRNKGIDVLYLPEPRILHLKAPMGGFRTKPKLAWENDEIQPKPSPTVMLFEIMHKTKQQNLGYKTILFFKYYKRQSTKNPFSYSNSFKKQWQRSLYWANKLNNTA